MEKKLLLLLFFLQTFSLQAEAVKTHMLVIGGSGDPRGAETAFDKSLSQIGAYSQNKKEKGELGVSSVAFDGGHFNTESIRNNKFPDISKKQDFTKETYKNELKRFKQLILEGKEIKKGEQLLIYINSHGAIKGKEKTHSIAAGKNMMTNLDSGSGAELVNLDQIEEIKKLAKEKGVKLGVVDLSCHSGNTINLADENTCVISSTGRDHYAFTTGFSGTFTANLKPGENLESVFLKTRKETVGADYPMISSPEGQLLERQMYELLTPYLNYRFDVNADKLTPELLKIVSDDLYRCEVNKEFKELNAFLDNMEKITSTNNKNLIMNNKSSMIDFEGFKKTLRDYKKIQDQLAGQLKAINADRLGKRVQINEKNSYSWAELINTDWNKWVKWAEQKLSTTGISKNDKETYERNLGVYKKCQQEKEKILKENPGIANYNEIVKKYDDGRKISERWAEKIADYEKKLFDGLYKKYSKEMSKSNICREFKL